MDNMAPVKQHFNDEAEAFDTVIKNLIPYYEQMVLAVINSIPFNSQERISVLDLGCGTGTIANAVKIAYPDSIITCVDISDKMLNVASGKIPDAIFIESDFYNFVFPQKYNVIVSSLALHHLVTKTDKLDFYHKIYDGLNASGVFINADVVLASTDSLQDVYMTQWKNFMLRNVTSFEVENKWIPSYHTEDRPISMLEHLCMLKETGFDNMDIVWKYYNFCVFMATKNEIRTL